MNGFKGFVGYFIKELNSNETNLYCLKNNATQMLPLVQTKDKFTSDFMLRSYSSGCYFYDTLEGKWSSDGMEIYEDTNLRQTHCSSNHLTSFAGGLDVMPSLINFRYSFSHGSFFQNPTIYSTVIAFVSLYILLSFWAKYMDSRDLLKRGVYLLKDNHPSESYFYELMIFTGNRSESQTNSKVIYTFYKILNRLLLFFLQKKVFLKINGDLNETGVRVLNEENKSALRRSAVDSFIMAVKK